MNEKDILTFFEQQKSEWPLAADNYEKLKNVCVKSFDFTGFSVRVHFNPARAVSSLANVDKAAIAARPCFLCAKNRPKEQLSLDFKEQYDILINPFPICPFHFTIASKQHEIQRLENKIDDMLDLATLMPHFLILYNGAHSGASAPDHFHFQAVNADFFQQPIETPMHGMIVKHSFASGNRNQIMQWFLKYYKIENDEECPMNVFCACVAGKWSLTIFSRQAHRPRQYFAEGAEKLMISPGAIDMTGNLIAVREEDFEKITREQIIDIYRQVSIINS